MYSSKDIGKASKGVKRRRLSEDKFKEIKAWKEQVEKEEPEIEESSEEEVRKEIVVRDVTQPVGGQSYDYIDKIKEMYSNKKPKQRDEPSSEDEASKPNMNLGDTKLQFITRSDQKQF